MFRASCTRTTSRFLALLGLFILLLVAPVPLEAASASQTGPIVVQQNVARVRYREGVEFRISAAITPANGEVNRAQLRLKYGKRAREEVYDVPLSAGTGSFLIQEETHPLVSGMPLYYNWILNDGKVQVQTPVQTVIYEDTRRQWQQREGPQVTVRWYDGDDNYGNLMYQLAADTLATYKRRFNFNPAEQIYISIYGSAAAYHTTFPDRPRWSGGFARYGGLEIVAIAPQGLNSSVFIGEGIPHELSHATLNQFVGGPTPRWLDEGFAVYNQNVISIRQYDDMLQQAYQSNALIPLRQLNTRWPNEERAALLAYAQGRSVVTFLINAYGNEVWSNLLDQLRRKDIDGALREVIGLDLDQIEELWKANVLKGQPRPLPPALKQGPVASRVTLVEGSSGPAEAQDRENFFWLLVACGVGGIAIICGGLVALAARRAWRRKQPAQPDPPVITPIIVRPQLAKNSTLERRRQARAAAGQSVADAPQSAPALSYQDLPQPVEELRPPAAAPPASDRPSPAGQGPLAGGAISNRASLEDPFDLIVARFGAGARTLNRPGWSPYSSASLPAPVELDPYGLNSALETEKTG